ncbi:SlyX family protein [Maritalea mediterranea]|uniref:Protein SlyX homolog n=1 Tax=Maritalea mediterranea TaxID=2909667 RepID=A0ABS9ECS4_9HYPH|nr:SlyX family protein [Maritalea mediterranea]MCF4099704.1 SlyX family protein [Maritalea mediterranea]
MSANEQLEARMEALEMRIAYQDQTIEDLNTTITKQWAEIDKLQREIAKLYAQMEEMDNGGGGEIVERPPHY